MKKVVALLLAALAPVCMAADWVPLAQTEDTAWYFDGQRTKELGQAGPRVSFWRLLDMRPTEAKSVQGYNSALGKIEVNCATDEIRVIYSVAYEGHMGTGSIVKTFNNPSPFHPIVPESVDERFAQFFCAKYHAAHK